MKVNVNLFGFRLGFKSPFNSGKDLLEKKDGFLISISDEEGNSAVSEISFLPGFTGTGIKEIISEVKKIKIFIEINNIPDYPREFLSYSLKFAEIMKSPPNIHFALDTALINLYEKREGKKISELIGFAAKGHDMGRTTEVKVNALIIPGNMLSDLKRVEEYVKNGFKTFKIKVGRTKRDRETELINKITTRFGRGIRIRTDSNMLMNFNESVDFFKNIGNEFIEYAEDPFPERERTPDFYSLTGVKIGIDLRLGSGNLNSLSPVGVGAVIIKPPLFGGIGDILNISRYCENKNVSLIFSSLMESGIGIINLAKVASLFNAHNRAMGFDTLKFINDDPLVKFPVISGGKVDPYNLPEIPLQNIYENKMLERIL